MSCMNLYVFWALSLLLTPLIRTRAPRWSYPHHCASTEPPGLATADSPVTHSPIFLPPAWCAEKTLCPTGRYQGGTTKQSPAQNGKGAAA